MSTPPDATLPTQIAAIRARLIALADAHANGRLDAGDYDAQRRVAERALGEAVLGTPAADPTTNVSPVLLDATVSSAAPAAPTALAAPVSRVSPVSLAVHAAPVSPVSPAAPVQPRPSSRLVSALALAVLALAVAGYAFKGSPTLALPDGATPQPVAAKGDDDREIGLQQIATMVDKLATRLKDQPDDAEGWTMLARSYTVLSRYGDAIPAYRHAMALQPTNAALIADYSDVVAANNGGQPNAESLTLLDRALAIDPSQPKALALSGTVAFDRGDYAMAVKQWQKIADALPPDGEFHRQVVANIDEARRRGGIAAPSAKSASPVSAGHEALSGTVTLSPALAAQVSPTDTVFVLARPESGRMPLAVFRATVRDLPLRFRLDDSMAMTPTMKISDMKQVIVAARVSKSGNAISQPGDLLGQTKPVRPGTSDLSVVIADVAPAK